MDWERARGMLGAVVGSSLGAVDGGGTGWSWLVGRGRLPGPATTERARWRKPTGGSSSLGGGGGGSSLLVSAGGGCVTDMRFGVLSRMFSNSLCCSRRPIMFSMYNARALFWSFRDLISASNRRVSSVFPSEDSSSSSPPSSSANEPNPDDCCMASVLVKSPFKVFSLSSSWKLSLSSNKRAFAIFTSSSFFSSSCT